MIGGGEHARVVIDAARSSGRFEIAGFLDPGARPDTAASSGVPQLMGDERALVADAVARGAQLALAVGEVGPGDKRRNLVERLGVPLDAWATVIHSCAWVSPSVRLAPGAVIMAGAMLNARAALGVFAVVNTGAVLEHDVVMGDFAQLGPGAVVGGGVTLGENAYVALGARVRDHVTIGPGALVGLGACVVGDVAAGAVVMGVPARPFKATRR